MKEVFRDSTTTIFEDENGNVFGIVKDSSRKDVYSVTVRKPGEKGRTIATRCLYSTAVELIKNER